MINTLCLCSKFWQYNLRIDNARIIALRQLFALLVERGKMPKFDAKECRLHLIKSGIYPLDLIVIAHFAAVVSHHAQLVRKRFIVCHHRPRIAERTKVFGRIKAKTACSPKRACHLPVKTCPVGLGTVLN